MNWTVSSPEPRRMSPVIFGVMAAFELALWIRVTPEVLWLRSIARVLPVAVSVPTVGVRVVTIEPVFLMLATLPERSMIAAALPRSPVTAPPMLPELTMLARLAPASIWIAVAWEARLVVEVALMTPSFTRLGVATPERKWMPVALAWKPEAVMLEELVTWMPPSIATW